MKLKPALLYFALLFSISFYGCKKDNNKTVSIVGKWSIDKTVYHYSKDTTIVGLTTDYYDFAEEGALTIQDHEDTYVGKYSMSGSNKVNINIYTIDGHGTGVVTPAAGYTISFISNNNISLSSPTIPAGQTVVYLKK